MMKRADELCLNCKREWASHYGKDLQCESYSSAQKFESSGRYPAKTPVTHIHEGGGRYDVMDSIYQQRRIKEHQDKLRDNHGHDHHWDCSCRPGCPLYGRPGMLRG